MQKIVCFYFLALLYTLPIYGQNLHFEHLDANSGLAGNGIFDIKQDPNGFIWIATENGLNRYDGFKFHQKEIELPDNFIRQVFFDNKGIMHITCPSTISNLVPEKGAFVHDTLPKEINNSRNRLFQDGQQALWLYNKYGLFTFKNRKAKIVRAGSVRNALVLPNDLAWIMTEDSVYLFDLNRKTYLKTIFTQKNAHLQCLYQDKKGNIWVGGAETPAFYYTQQGEKVQTNIPSLDGIVEDLRGQVWIANRDGIGVYNPLTKSCEMEAIQTGEDELRNEVTTLMCDRTGIIWIGTYVLGIYKLNPYSKQIPTYHPQLVADKNIRSAIIKAFCTEKESDNVWIAGRTGTIYLWHLPEKRFEMITQIPVDASCFSICKISSNELLIGGYKYPGNALFIWDTKTKKISQVTSPKEMPIVHVTDIKIDHQENIWLSTLNGLICWKRKTNEWDVFSDWAKKGQNKIALQLAPHITNENLWWVSTGKGVYELDIRSHLVKFFPICAEIDQEEVLNVCHVSADEIWILLRSRDVWRYNFRTKKAEHLQKEMGCAIVKDDSGNIWISHNKGISCYEFRTKNWLHYEKSDGLQGYEFNDNAALLTHQGNVLFGGAYGFNAISPLSLCKNTATPQIVLTGFSVYDNKRLDFFQIQNTKEITLSYKENFFRIDFLLTDYVSPFKNKYEYQLVNMDKDWKKCEEHQRTAPYTSVPPGTYTFRVRATNNEGVWSKNIASITIKVLPPFWETWTFRITVLLVIGGLIYYLWKKEMTKQAMQQQIIALENKALRAQMNPHFIFNALNSIQDFIIDNNAKEASKYLNKFAKLIRLMLDNSEHSFVSLQKELDLLMYYIELERLRFNHNFEYIFEKSVEIDTYNISIPTMMIQPHVENAIWHGLQHKKEGGTLHLRIYLLDEEQLVCEVEDDGIGREAAKAIRQNRHKDHESKGLSITENRLKLFQQSHNQSIGMKTIDKYDENGKATGTKIIITLPFK